VAFVYDRYGSLTSQRTYGAAGATSYAYDLADRLTQINQADASVIGTPSTPPGGMRPGPAERVRTSSPSTPTATWATPTP
jgi:hypothetical protein